MLYEMTSGQQGQPLGAGKLTYEDLVSLPDDGNRYEILDGRLAVTPPPSTGHQRFSRNLEIVLHRHVTANELGEVLHAPVGVVLDEHTIVEPDIVYVSRERAHIVQAHAIVGPTDLIVEILSPSTADRDRGIKARLYASYGVEHYWIADVERSVLETYRRAGDAYEPSGRYEGGVIVREEPFPDLAIDLRAVWPPPPPAA